MQTIDKFQALKESIGSILSITSCLADIISTSELECLQMLFNSWSRMSLSSRYFVKKMKSWIRVFRAKPYEPSEKALVDFLMGLGASRSQFSL